MTEIKDILHYGCLSYLVIGISYCAAKDLYNYIGEKIKSHKEKKKSLESRLKKDNTNDKVY